MNTETKHQKMAPQTQTVARIGCFSYSGVGHVSPLLALARRLQARGHELVFFQLPDLESRIRAAQVPFAAYGEDDFPVGSLARELWDMSQLEGPAAFERAIAALTKECRIVLREGPELIRKHRIEFLLVDECCDAGSTLASTLHIPFVSLALALTRCEEPGVPHWGCPLPYSVDPAVVAQYAVWSNGVSALSIPLLEPINQERARFRLPPVKHVMETHSELATISQQPAEFDFPRKELPPSFHYTGPFLDPEARPALAFPWEQLDGRRPLVYASLGTLQNGLPAVFRIIAEACAPLDVQLVMGLGSGLLPEELGNLPGNPLVLSDVPQLQLLQRAQLMITHAGMNSALECLSYGIPMVAIPIAYDQPNIAQRIAWTGTGTVVPLETLTVERMRDAVKRVLADPSYRTAARLFQLEIQLANGLDHAADLVERVIHTGAPVLREGHTVPASPIDRLRRTPANEVLLRPFRNHAS
jgi:zeaxanthin glucosyltransferase